MPTYKTKKTSDLTPEEVASGKWRRANRKDLRKIAAINRKEAKKSKGKIKVYRFETKLPGDITEVTKVYWDGTTYNCPWCSEKVGKGWTRGGYAERLNIPQISTQKPTRHTDCF